MDLQGFTAVETSMQTIFQFSTICVAILVEYNPVAYFKTSLNSEHCITASAKDEAHTCFIKKY